jgi:hypothetical protein
MRIALGYLALISLEIGLWAQFAPRSFYDNYPGLGRAWVAVDGPYNEHLVRDVGGLNLGLAAVLIMALVTLSQTTIVAASLARCSGVPHPRPHSPMPICSVAARRREPGGRHYSRRFRR